MLGPQTFRPSDAPYYRSAQITIIVCDALCILDLLFIYAYYRRQNRAKAVRRAEPTYVKLGNQEFLDLTDRENAEFVYSL